MIFPKHKHSVGIFRKFGQEGKRRTCFIRKNRGASRGVESHSHHIGGSTRRSERKGFHNRAFEHLNIIQRVLTVPVGGGQTIFALHPAGIVFYRGSNRFSGTCVNYYRTGRIGPVIESYYIFIHTNKGLYSTYNRSRSIAILS